MESANGIISCGAEDAGIAAVCISVSVSHCVGKPPVPSQHVKAAVFWVKNICLKWSAEHWTDAKWTKLVNAPALTEGTFFLQ